MRNASWILLFSINGILLLALLSVPTIGSSQGRPNPAPTDTIAPTATSKPTTTNTPTPTLSVEERLTNLEASVKNTPKDFWDKFEIVSSCLTSLITGVLIAGLGILATYVYNERQRKSEDARAKRELNVTEIQTVQSFMPQLQSGEPKAIQAALLAIASLGNKNLATKLAELYSSSSADPSVIDAVGRTMMAIFNQPMQAIVQIACGDEIRGVGYFVRSDGYVITTHNAVDGQGALRVITSTSDLAATLVHQIPDDNLALLKVDGQGYQYLLLTPDLIPSIESTVYLIGRDPEIGLTINAGKIIGPSRVDIYPRSELFRVDVNVPREYGGASVLSASGQYIGMVVLMWAKGEAASQVYLLPTAAVRTFIEEALKS